MYILIRKGTWKKFVCVIYYIFIILLKTIYLSLFLIQIYCLFKAPFLTSILIRCENICFMVHGGYFNYLFNLTIFNRPLPTLKMHKYINFLGNELRKMFYGCQSCIDFDRRSFFAFLRLFLFLLFKLNLLIPYIKSTLY